MLLRKRMKERTRAQIRAGATHTRSPSFGSRSVEKELRNWAWNGKCRVTERASWPAPRHWQTNQRTHTSITQLAAPRHMKNAGHLSRECAQERKAITCYLCGKEGHMSNRCPTAPQAGACFHCGQRGHISRQCPSAGSNQCFKCKRSGHMAKDCPEA